jgi:DNA-binding NtrC family response regulator
LTSRISTYPTARQHLVVIDDDSPSRRLIAATFEAEGFNVAGAATGATGIDLAVTGCPDVILLDLGLPDMDGLDVLRAVRSRVPDTPVVMLTADHDIRSAIAATRLGAYDYLTKPIDHDAVLAVVRRALEMGALRAEVVDLRRKVADAGNLALLMGPSHAIADVDAQVSIVAASRLTVLIVGETGTGKEIVAQAIHQRSGRHRGPFVALDCGAIPEALLESELFGHEKGAFTGAERKREGRFQLAEGGTLLLDEVANLPPALQAKLLRALESAEVQSVGGARPTPLDVRFIAATNVDLQASASAGRFRADLYFRLAQYTLRLPPLRDRPGDIPHLVSRFAREASIELRRPVGEISEGAKDLLVKQAWPGNVRELRNVVRQAVLETKDLVVGKEVVRSVLGRRGPPTVRPAHPGAAAGSLREIATRAARAAEREAICQALRRARGNKALAARDLETDYKTLHLKMKSLMIRAKDFEP